MPRKLSSCVNMNKTVSYCLPCFFFRKVSHSPSDRVTYGAVLILSWSDQIGLKFLIWALFENRLFKVFAILTGTGVQPWKRQETFLLLRISCNRLNQMVWCHCKLHVLFHTCESLKFSSYRFLKIFLHSDNVVDYLDVDGDEVGDSEGKESWLLEAPDISLSTTNPSFASIPYFLKYFLDILFSFFLLLSTTCSIS